MNQMISRAALVLAVVLVAAPGARTAALVQAPADAVAADVLGERVPGGTVRSVSEVPPHPEADERPLCEDPQCGTSVQHGACEACSLFRQVMNPEHLARVSFSGFLIEGGVALRATTHEPWLQEQLFAVAVARNEILQQVHEGARVDLCEPCVANARSFIDVQFGVERIPEGVILSYTSTRDDLVALLQVMLMNGHELPL